MIIVFSLFSDLCGNSRNEKEYRGVTPEPEPSPV